MKKKYIDAEKLTAKIKELNLVTKTYDEQVAFNNALAMVVEVITSLQQEQPECIYGRTLEERKKSCKFCSAICEARIKVDVNKRAVTHAFLHCERAGKIVSEMYGEQFNNIPRNYDRYLTFLKQVELDDRFGELAGILQRYGAMPEPKEQPEADVEKEYKTWWNSVSGKINIEHVMEWYMHETARHFYELGLNTEKEEKI